MGKTKSAVLLTFITLVIAVLCVVCFVSFPCGEISYYNSLLSLTSKDAGFGGNLIGDTAYVGGGYAVVYYPEGVISSREYEETIADKTGTEQEAYRDQYVSHANGAIYLEKETVCGGGETVTDDFKASFQNSVDMLKTRFEKLHEDGVSLSVQDDYTIRVFLPATASGAGTAFQYLGYTGEFNLAYGSDEDDATQILPVTKGTQHPASYYVKSAGLRSSSGTYYVVINFTDEGREAIADATSAASSDSTNYIYFYVGENHILTLTVTEQIDQSSLYISGSYTAESAAIVVSLIDSSVKQGSEEDLAFTMSEISYSHASYGDGALTCFYIVFGVASLLMLVFFFIRYGRLGFAHLYSYLSFLILMTLCFWSISSLYIGGATIVALCTTAALLCISNAVCFEYVRREYAGGKTMTFSVKTGYKKCTWSLFDIHIVLAAFSLLVFLIAIADLSVFGLALTLGAVFSGVCSLLFNRFFWYIMMPFAKNQGKFCNFKRTEVEDDE